MSSRKPRAHEPAIKWIRLQAICLGLLGPGITLHVHASTEVPPDMCAAVERRDDRIDILMNMLYNKTLEDVIDNLAHEMAHIVLSDPDHGPAFDEKWDALRTEITREYESREAR
ncbi:MAG: hypothetical protein KA243_00440 [Candidatus Aminicenantes bacterium]|nr:hypothetical protein [Candidatus Aminicenantes bacterium]